MVRCGVRRGAAVWVLCSAHVAAAPRWVISAVKTAHGTEMVPCAVPASGFSVGEDCPYLRYICKLWTTEADACAAAIGERLEDMAAADTQAVVGMDGDYAAAVDVPAGARAPELELSLAVMWRSAPPVVLDVAQGSIFPLSFVSRGPLAGTACFALHSTTPGMFGAALMPWNTNESFELICENEPGQLRADDVREGDDDSLGLAAMPFILRTLQLTRPGTVEVLLFARSETSLLPTATGARHLATLNVVAPAAALDAPRPGREWVAECADVGSCSRVFMNDVEAVPLATRRSRLERVAYDAAERTLLVFENGAGFLRAPPNWVLGRMQSGAVVGGWKRVRRVNSTFAAFTSSHCAAPSARITRRVLATRFIQQPTSQYHVLYTGLTALERFVAEAWPNKKGEAPLVLFDAEMGEALMVDKTDAMATRAASQMEFVLGTGPPRLWRDALPQNAVHRFWCLDSLDVNVDSRDMVAAWIHATHALFAPNHCAFRNPNADSQFARSKNALLRLRAALIEHFAPPPAMRRYDAPAGGEIRLTVIDRRGAATRRFADVGAVVDAARRGCGPACAVAAVALEDLSYVDQIALLAETDVLVGVEGQGLANMLYMRSDAAVVVLVPPGFNESVVEYATIASMLGLVVATSVELAGRPEPVRLRPSRRAEYWAEVNEVVDFDAALVEALVRRAVDLRGVATGDCEPFADPDVPPLVCTGPDDTACARGSS
ncbi:hypothetical protein M885DRAFT_611523 [Pelagophyceae sp. CCMP2097]|nr:hypothetical protein M885DRAFT_611523 [Pelagophyceae sp. CCMP2097]